MADERYSVGELADLGGVSRRTVRYYVQEGLLPTPLGVGRGDAHRGFGDAFEEGVVLEPDERQRRRARDDAQTLDLNLVDRLAAHERDHFERRRVVGRPNAECGERGSFLSGLAARQRERGFNQAELLAAELRRVSGLTVRNVLQRTRYTATQTQFDRSERMENLRGAFRLRRGSNVQDLRMLLVDDVLTTGSTLSECASVLREAGALSVHAVTAARG